MVVGCQRDDEQIDRSRTSVKPFNEASNERDHISPESTKKEAHHNHKGQEAAHHTRDGLRNSSFHQPKKHIHAKRSHQELQSNVADVTQNAEEPQQRRAEGGNISDVPQKEAHETKKRTSRSGTPPMSRTKNSTTNLFTQSADDVKTTQTKKEQK